MLFFDSFFERLSVQLGGIPLDQLQCIFSLLMAYPLSLVYRKLPDNPTMKHLYSISVTSFLFVVVNNQFYGFFHIFFGCTIPYLISTLVKSSLGPKLVFVFAMGHMSYTHIYRQIHDYGGYTLDHSGPQMIMAIKMTSFAWSVYDGTKLDETLSDYQKTKVIRQFPSFLEYLGYIFHFGNFMVGPPFEFADYRRFTTLEVFRADKSEKLAIPDGLPSGMKCLFSSLIYLALTVLVSPYYPIQYCLTAEYRAKSFFYRFLYINVVSLANRFKYYSVWLMAEGACVVSGLGFNGYEHGKVLWDRASNVDIWGYEAAQNIRDLTRHWNVGTNKWLRHYVYVRITPPGTKPTFMATLLTFGVSALWHGFYPGYYLMFLSTALTSSVAAQIRKILRPYFLHSDMKTPTSGKRFYDILGWLTTQTVMNYNTMAFIILGFKESIIIWSANYFIGHVIILTLLVYFNFVHPSPSCPKGPNVHRPIQLTRKTQ